MSSNFTAFDRTVGQEVNFRVEKSIAAEQSVYLRIDSRFSGHLSSDEARSLARALEQAADEAEEAVGYRGRQVPGYIQASPDLYLGFRLGVDAVLDPETEQEDVHSASCGAVRSDRQFDGYPCDRPDGHEDCHVDSDDDPFVDGVKI